MAKSPIADKKYKKEVVRLLKKLPFSVGVRFYKDELYPDEFFQVRFSIERAETLHTRQFSVHSHTPPPDYLVKHCAYELIEAILNYEDE